MADKVLSQQEIESLISGLAEPEPVVPVVVSRTDTTSSSRPARALSSVKVYDFRRPDKFSKEQLRALRILHGSFSRSLGSALSSYLRSSAQISLTMVEQVTYDEYIRSLPTPTVIFVVDLAPLGGQIVIEINHNVARAILDRLLGGSGLVVNQTREMTEIELALLKTVGGFLTSSLRDTWSSVVELTPTFGAPALSPEFVQVTLASETTAMLVFEISLLQTTGTISFCLPHPLVQPVMEKITALVWSANSSQTVDPNTSLGVDRELTPVPLELSVGLGSAAMTVRELMRLSEGQVIKLDLPANGSLPIRIGEWAKFWGRPGLIGKNLAVQVTNGPEQEQLHA